MKDFWGLQKNGRPGSDWLGLRVEKFNRNVPNLMWQQQKCG